MSLDADGRFAAARNCFATIWNVGEAIPEDNAVVSVIVSVCICMCAALVAKVVTSQAAGTKTELTSGR